jgi:hypothetical protein
LYLPPSEAPPDLNPIEEAFSKIMGLLLWARARTRDALIGALSAVAARDAWDFIEHCGYRLSA